MLVVNAALAAKTAGHEVVIYTSHHDPNRCFRDTTGNGEKRDIWLPVFASCDDEGLGVQQYHSRIAVWPIVALNRDVAQGRVGCMA